MTFKQALEKKAAVRKGEKGTHVVFTKRITVGEEDEEKQIAMLKTFVVFNVAQIDGLTLSETVPESVPEIIPFVSATNARIEHGGDRAFYASSKDFIGMPPPSAFRSEQQYQATLLHECCHWTGHESRLDRQLGNRFGTRAYAAEELIAELGAAFLCAHLGIQGDLRHAGYIESWIELLKDDDRAIFTAASKASQAADYLRSFSEPLEPDGP
jgi:antirestriction protein ArdC